MTLMVAVRPAFILGKKKKKKRKKRRMWTLKFHLLFKFCCSSWQIYHLPFRYLWMIRWKVLGTKCFIRVFKSRTFNFIENIVKLGFRAITSEIYGSEFVTNWTQNCQWKVKAERRMICCSQTILMLQKVKIMPAETFTSNSDDFETTRYMGPQWQKVPRKPVKLDH